MKRSCLNLPVVIAVALSLLLTPLPGTASSSQKNKKVFGETRRDAALVYIYWDDTINMRFFCDDQLLGAFHGHDYTFAYIAPGTHFFWGHWLGELGLCDLAAGQTYYLSVSGKYRLSILSEADGQASIKRAKAYRQLTEEQCTKAAGVIAQKWPEYKKKLGNKLTLAGGEIVYTPPASTENMVRIPAGTAVVAELMENLDSGINKMGDAVWLRVVEDVSLDGKLFVQAGAPVKGLIRDVDKRGRFGAGGRLDLTIPSLVVADGTVCPLIGQAVTDGSYRSPTAAIVAGSVVGGIPGGLVLASLVKGAESLYPAGGTVKVFTRQDIWIKPLRSTNDVSASGKPSEIVKAHARGKIVCDLTKGNIPQVVEIVFEGAGEIASAELVRVAGWEMPAPVRASKLSRATEGWIAQFGGWDICRFLRLGDAGTQLAFRLTATDGTVVIAQGAVSITMQ